MKKVLFFLLMFLLSGSLFSQEEVKLKSGRTIIVNTDGTWVYKQENINNTFTDSRDGHVYKIVTIGKQTWMAENLAYKASSGCWAYNNEQNNVATYGYLYNWETAKKVCPVGWHLPSDVEWTTLTDYLGGASVAGGKLKEIGATHWNNTKTQATNETYFTALPGGYRYNDGIFSNIGSHGNWWSATEDSTTNAYYQHMDCYDSNVYRSHGVGSYGFSVRCVRD